MTTPTVDVHAHLALPGIEEAVAGWPERAAARELDARRVGPEALAVNGTMIRDRVPKLTDVKARLAAMDTSGVDVQLVSPVPDYHYWADEDLARTVNPSGAAPRRPGRCSSCTPSAAPSTSAWTAGTCPTPSASPPRTPSRCPI